MPETELNLDTAFNQAYAERQAQEPTPSVGEPTPAPTKTVQQQAEPQAPAQPAGSGTQPLPASLLARAKASGLSLDGITTHDQLANAVLDAYIQDRPYASHGRQALTQPAPVQEPEPAQEVEGFDETKFFSEAWNVPSLSPGAQWALQHGAFTENDNGMLGPAQGLEQVALPYLKEINDYQQAKARQYEAFSANPVKFVLEKAMPYLRHHLVPEIQQYTNQGFQNYEQSNFVEKFKTDNRTWLYAQDGQTLSPEGQKFAETVAELRQHGMDDPQKLAAYAIKIAGINTAPAAPTDPAAMPALESGRERDGQGRFKPAGTPAPAPVPTKQESFIEKARRNAGAASNYAGVNNPEESVLANEGELDNMFATAWKQATA